jgi:Protein of unknown function (DUF4199)
MAILDEQDGSINESSVSIQPVVMKWGLISAGVGIVFQLISSLLGVGAMAYVVSFIGMGVGIYVLALAVRADRDDQLGGYASFKRVFIVAFAVILLSSIITQVFNYVYMNFLNPAAADAALEATRSMLEKLGMAEDQIDTALEKAAADLKSPMNILKSMIGIGIVGAIIAAIYGAVMKKERPMFN